jgi:hypothetical protein
VDSGVSSHVLSDMKSSTSAGISVFDDSNSTNVPGCISKLISARVGEGEGVNSRIDEDAEPRSRPRWLCLLQGFPKGQGMAKCMLVGLLGGMGSCEVQVFEIGSIATLLLRRWRRWWDVVEVKRKVGLKSILRCLFLVEAV